MSSEVRSASAYRFHHIEEKWQKKWKEENAFVVPEDASGPFFYVLEFFPYPSGALHMGHARNYVLGDVMARHRRALGYYVLHPMGWDALGLPAENAAIQRGVHPKEWTYANANGMKRECQSLGFSHDWSREIFSCDPDYYKHEQKMFLDFFRKNLVYRKNAYVNWDPVENSVLANEQVIDGKGWRSGAVVEKRLLEQWFMRITDFAEDLLDGIEELTEWPDSVRQMQRNWIGKSTGVRVRFSFLQEEEGALEIFTTRPETLFGASFCAIAPDHPFAQKWAESNPALKEFLEECRKKSTSSRTVDTEEKKGVFTGYSVVHPLIPQQVLPIYVANFVLLEYGTGAIYGSPAHDQRDFEFAQKYGLPIVPVVQPFDGQEPPSGKAYVGDGIMVHSEFLNGLPVQEAREKMITVLCQKNVAEKEIVYSLKDWNVSRQRYWGAPIPIIYCSTCGIVPVPEKDLPVVLPEDVSFDKPGNPLEHHPTWKNVSCPSCGKDARRETDTLDTFFESSWYFARFCDPHNDKEAFCERKIRQWMPVNQYIGGIEHAVLHLLYARFFSRALSVCGYWDMKEPFQKLLTQGMVCHRSFRAQDGTWLYPTEVEKVGENTFRRISDGTPVEVGRSEKMSKSKCNLVDVNFMVGKYGADPLRLFLLSDTPPEKDLEWTDEGIEGNLRYIHGLLESRFEERIALIGPKEEVELKVFSDLSKEADDFQYLFHRTIASIDKALERYHLNRYIAHLRELSNAIDDFTPQNEEEKRLLRHVLEGFIQLCAPAIPHLAEECWEKLGHAPFVHQYLWPSYDPALLELSIVTISIQLNGKARGVCSIPVDASDEFILEKAKENPAVQKALVSGTLQKVVIIPHRTISLVVK